MSTNSNRQVSYGLSQPLINEAQVPIIAQRIPTTSDKAQIGTIWIDQVTNAAYILTSIVNNMAMWEGIGGPASALTFDTDSGTATPSGDVIDIAGGTNMNTSGLGNIVTINLDDTVSILGSLTTGTGVTIDTGDLIIDGGNLYIPNTSGSAEGTIYFGGIAFINNFGTANTFMGSQAGTFGLSGVGNNTGIGYVALQSLTTGFSNTGIGSEAGFSISSSVENTAIGQASLTTLSSGNGDNVAVGWGAAANLSTGDNNVILGASAGTNYFGAESSNILIGSEVLGTYGESNIIRIGNQGSGTAQQDQCYIAGITGNTVSNTELVTIDSTTGQLGVTSVGSVGIPWQTVTTDTQLDVNNGYFVNGADTLTLTLPLAAAVGDVIEIRVLGTAVNSWIIAQNAGQQVVGNATVGTGPTVTTVGVTGNVDAFDSNQYFSSLSLVCATTDTIFVANNYVTNVEFN